jgi:Cation transporter/ATPase, N-terminus
LSTEEYDRKFQAYGLNQNDPPKKRPAYLKFLEGMCGLIQP